MLDGIVTGKGSKGEAAQERQQMGFILHSLLTGREVRHPLVSGFWGGSC